MHVSSEFTEGMEYHMLRDAITEGLQNCRTALLAGLATALIFGGLSLRKLTEARAEKTLKVVKGSATRTHLLQEPYADLYTEGKEGDEPCGESCSKDHVHSHSAPVGHDRIILCIA